MKISQRIAWIVIVVSVAAASRGRAQEPVAGCDQRVTTAQLN